MPMLQATLTTTSKKKRRNSRSWIRRSVSWRGNCTKSRRAVRESAVRASAAAAALPLRKAAVPSQWIREMLENWKINYSW